MPTLHLVDPVLVPPSGQIPSPNFRIATLPEVRASMSATAIAALPIIINYLVLVAREGSAIDRV